MSSFWTSNWSHFGKLSSYLRNDTPISTGIPLHRTLADLFRGGNWILPPARSNEFLNIQIHLTTMHLTAAPDQFIWVQNSLNNETYSTRSTYELLKHHQQQVTWHKEIWFSGAVPRHRFLAWLFALNRCPTRDRLLGWGLQTSPLCLLCNCEPESRNHLFFDCDFTSEIWRSVGLRIGLQTPRTWEDNLLILKNTTAPAYRKILACLCWQATIYLLWAERNHRLHNNSSRPAHVLLRRIDLLIRNRASSLRDSRPKLATNLLQAWFAGSFGPIR